MVFSIKKGSHYSNNILYKICSFFNTNEKVSYMVTFDDSGLYIDDTLDKYDVNKLFGFSNGWHHKNSYRFGWNSLYGKIHVYGYSYINGKRFSQEFAVIRPNEEYRMTIRVKNGKCIYTITDSEFKINQIVVNVPSKSIYGYMLWPYFGGNKTAPQKIKINLGKTV